MSPPPTAARPRIFLYLPWIFLILLYGSLVGMLHFRVAHPHFFLVASLTSGLVLSTVVAILVGLTRLVFGWRRCYGVQLLTFGSIPLVLVALHWVWALTHSVDYLRTPGYPLRVLLP